MNIRGDLMVETSDGRTVKLCEWIEAIEKRVAELERRVPEQPKEDEFQKAILSTLYHINFWIKAVACYFVPKKSLESLLKAEFEQNHLACNVQQEKHLNDNH